MTDFCAENFCKLFDLKLIIRSENLERSERFAYIVWKQAIFSTSRFENSPPKIYKSMNLALISYQFFALLRSRAYFIYNRAKRKGEIHILVSASRFARNFAPKICTTLKTNAKNFISCTNCLSNDRFLCREFLQTFRLETDHSI